MTITKQALLKLHNALFEIPKTYVSTMRVPARVFTNEEMLEEILKDRSLEQLTNVASLPGIQKYALAMPDIHEGYGFPIGGVAALAIHQGGVISPGGIGYDINCGVRLLALTTHAQEIVHLLPKLATALFESVPSGVGKGGALALTEKQMTTILRDGAHALIKMGYGTESDLEYCEEQGRMTEADPDTVSEKARTRGADQLGTLGSGNHFLEIQRVEKIYNAAAATAYGLEEDQVTIMIHCGSRGLGHQNASDYIARMLPKLTDWGIVLPDEELACAPFTSPEGQAYYHSMCAAANFAWANRHLIGHRVREACTKILGSTVAVRTIYDISHNMGKKETHLIDGKERELIVHRKGATRAFPAGHPDNPSAYHHIGHPVFVPGTMGTSSYVLVGTQTGLEETFGSSCHGAGRRMSRAQTKRTIRGSTLRQELEARGILIRSHSDPGLAEEAPLAYKDVDSVIDVITHARIAEPVVRLKPLAVIKGD